MAICGRHFLLRSNKVPGYPPDAKHRGRVRFLLRSNKVPEYPPDAKHRGRVRFLLRSNKVPGYPPDAKHRGRVGFLLYCNSLTFLFQKYLQNHIQVFLTLKLINFYFLLRYLQEYRLLLYIFCHFSLLF